MKRRCFASGLEPRLGRKHGDRLFRGKSPDCVRRDQVGTTTLPQRGCGLKNREGAGGGCLELPNTPSSRTEETDHVDRPRSSAMPNLHFQIARMISSHVPRCSALCELYLSRRPMRVIEILQQLLLAQSVSDQLTDTVMALLTSITRFTFRGVPVAHSSGNPED